MTQMEHDTAGARASEPELDEALARAIRLLISDAIDSGVAADAVPVCRVGPHLCIGSDHPIQLLIGSDHKIRSDPQSA